MVIIKEKNKKAKVNEKYTNFIKAVENSFRENTFKTLVDTGIKNKNTTFFVDTWGYLGIYDAAVMGIAGALESFAINYLNEGQKDEIKKISQYLLQAKVEALQSVRRID